MATAWAALLVLAGTVGRLAGFLMISHADFLSLAPHQSGRWCINIPTGYDTGRSDILYQRRNNSTRQVPPNEVKQFISERFGNQHSPENR